MRARGPARAWGAVGAVLLVAGACGGDATTVLPRSLDRPGDFAFVCVDDSGEPLGLDACDPDGEGDLYVLVLQTERGEVASISLTERRVVDTDRRIPGYTFAATGELPSAIVAPTARPRFVYVADFGSQDVRAIPVARLLGLTETEDDAAHAVALPGGPTELLILPDGSALVAAIPAAGALARIPLDADGVMGAAELLTLGDDIPEPIPTEADGAYCKACPTCDDLLSPGAVAARAPVSRGAGAAPGALAFDGVAERLVVADEHLPVLHVVRVDGALVEEPPFVVGVPTRDVAVTPEVPEVLDGSTVARRYVYAVDATDGSLLAVDAATGGVLAVAAEAAGAAVDRVALPAGVRTVEVMTPEFPGDACEPDADGARGAAPTRLRGVFVVAGLDDGTLRVIDVHDLDATCRGGDLACDGPPREDDQLVFIRRHRPRLGETLRDAAIEVVNLSDRVASTGAVVALEPIECPEDMAAAETPGDGDVTGALVCALSDPWAAVAETWRARFEGALPGSGDGPGRLDAEATEGPTLFGRVDFCAVGALGAEDVPGEGPEAGYAGDMLVITTDGPPPSTEDDDACAFWDAGTDGEPVRLEFPIVRAYSDRLVVERHARAGAADVGFDTVAACMVELVDFEIRAREAFVVVGSATGFLHRVVPGADGRCTVDAGADVRRNGRAFGAPLDNGRVAFDPAVPTAAGIAELSFALSGIPGKLAFGTGGLPSALHFNPVDGRLYAVDVAASTFSQIDLDSWSLVRAYE